MYDSRKRHLSEETKAKMSLSHKLRGTKPPSMLGKKWSHPMSKEDRVKIGLASIGRKHTEEWKKEARERMLGNKYMTGKKHSKETIGKIKINSGHSCTDKQRFIMSERMKGIKNPMYGKTELARQAGFKGSMVLRQKKPTSIEKKLYEELKKRGLLFETQKLINKRFLVDVYIPSLNLIIEADGDYWHNLDRVVKKDKAENAYLKKCGYNLLRLTEKEINNGSFVQSLPIN